MSDNPNDQQQALAALLQQMQQPNPMMMGMQTQQSPAGALIQGVAVPVKVQTPMGDMRSYLQLPAEIASNPMMLANAVQMLAQQGWQIDTWQPRQNNYNNGGNWNNGGGGGWNNNGYGGRGGYGRGRY